MWHRVRAVLLWCALAGAARAQLVDELQTYEKKCLGEDMFQCIDGGCVAREQQCDGTVDCTDGSDENFCLGRAPDAALCEATRQYLCADGRACIPRTWLCNSYTECEDGSDEANCTAPVPPAPAPADTNRTRCGGFACGAGAGACISRLWVCDAAYDCADGSDELPDQCRHSLHTGGEYEWEACGGGEGGAGGRHPCLDRSYCLPHHMMCDGLRDCRDGSDEGTFCQHWHTMCSNSTCEPGAGACVATRGGARCSAPRPACEQPAPRCPQACVPAPAGPAAAPAVPAHRCECAPGYRGDGDGNECRAMGPEGMLFLSTQTDIRYIGLRSRRVVTVVTGLKQAHGVSYDGNFVYWVETARGHQCVVRARLQDVAGTREVVVSLGLEDAGDVAVDWRGGHVYFGDAERGHIAACRADGSLCTTLRTNSRLPKFVTLDPINGAMYWADWHSGPVIMSARMDGSRSEPLVDSLAGFPTGLAMDQPGGRLYYVDKTIKGVLLSTREVFSVEVQGGMYRPYSVSVFEGLVYWSDWASNAVRAAPKVRDTNATHSTRGADTEPYKFDTPVYGLHVYHPALQGAGAGADGGPCAAHAHACSHLCLLRSGVSHTCACPDGMRLVGNKTCQHLEHYRPEYLVLGSGSSFTRVQYNALGNPETHAAHFDVADVRAMAYDNTRDTLYVYDGRRGEIRFVNMSEFALGVTHALLDRGLGDVVDMDYDYVSDCLYVLAGTEGGGGEGRGRVEVVSLSTLRRAVLLRLPPGVTPLSFCLMPDYGQMVIAKLISVPGEAPRPVLEAHALGAGPGAPARVAAVGIKGPRVVVRYAAELDNAYFADEGNRAIDFIHPKGEGRETYRELTTPAMALAVTGTYVFWTGPPRPRAPPRPATLYWANVHETRPKIRRMDFSVFQTDKQVHLQVTSPRPRAGNPLLAHPCRRNVCADVCVQTPHAYKVVGGYRCLCSDGLVSVNGTCVEPVRCGAGHGVCRASNTCFPPGGRCDGRRDCEHGEDEAGCTSSPPPAPAAPASPCAADQTFCNGLCIDHNHICTPATAPGAPPPGAACTDTQHACASGSGAACIPRWQACDGRADCADGSDEAPALCDAHDCHHTEFMCASGSCVPSAFACDGEADCPDGSDELACARTRCAAGLFECGGGGCVPVHRRCDGNTDCADGADERDCGEEPVAGSGGEAQEEAHNCAEWEYPCELNRTICVPLAARCNGRAECPGATDEALCRRGRCAGGGWRCGGGGGRGACVAERAICDGRRDCADGTDESAQACAQVNATSRSASHAHPFAAFVRPREQCGAVGEGYPCASGQCVEWARVCDGAPDCIDGSDEGGLCSTPCAVGAGAGAEACSHLCRRSPAGPACACPAGLRARADGRTCADVDECATRACPQACHNVLGTYLCACHHGYTLRWDRRSCKADGGGRLAVYYAAGNSVYSKSAGVPAPAPADLLEYTNPDIVAISGMDIDVRRNKLYVTSAEAGELVEVSDSRRVLVTNIGRPTTVAVDWVTGNVYFVSSAPEGEGEGSVRVCHVARRRCARLHALPARSHVTALVVDPASHRMFYCVRRDGGAAVWSASLSGRSPTVLAPVRACTGLAADSFSRRLLVAQAEAAPAQILEMDYEGGQQNTIIKNETHLEAPRGLALFEDHAYYLATPSASPGAPAGSRRVSRCALYGARRCEVYLRGVAHGAAAFALRHESVQRGDVRDACARVPAAACAGVCVGGEGGGPACVCADGTVSGDGTCHLLEKSELPLFDGRTHQEQAVPAGGAPGASAALAAGGAALALLAACALVLLFYRFVYRRRRRENRPYLPVLFRHASPASAGSSSATLTPLATPSVRLPVPDTAHRGVGGEWGRTHEYTNPFEFIVTTWRKSFQKHGRPIGTEGLTVDVPTPPGTSSQTGTSSDTESDIDGRDSEMKSTNKHPSF